MLKMYRQPKFVIAASILAVSFLLVSGERSEAITAGASAQIAIPVSIVETTPLDHGTVTASGSLGTVVVSVAGARSVTGGVAELGGSPTQGVFTITGEANSAFTTTMDPTSSLTGPGTAMVATLSNDAPANLTAGSATINVASDLAVGANQTSGAYSGTFSITVNY